MRLATGDAAQERRLAAALAAHRRSADDPELLAIVEDAQLLGSLELAGVPVSWPQVRASRQGADVRPEVAAWRRALSAVAPGEPLSVRALLAWHAALVGAAGFRRGPREREDAAPAPPEAIADRISTLEEWLSGAGARGLLPAQAACLAYARILEVLPFDEANGRVARLAASHLMVGRGRRPPILGGADAAYLLACLRAAFRLDTGPLVALFDEASSRAADVMIQALERGLS